MAAILEGGEGDVVSPVHTAFQQFEKKTIGATYQSTDLTFSS